jgi:hypothetical protein
MYEAKSIEAKDDETSQICRMAFFFRLNGSSCIIFRFSAHQWEREMSTDRRQKSLAREGGNYNISLKFLESYV